jgi:PIF1-like helicase
MRNAQDPEFCEYTDSIGEDAEGSREITLQHLTKPYNQEDSLSWLYPDEILLRPDLCIKRSFLSVLNAWVDEINDLMLDRLPGEEKVYWSYDTVKEGNVPNLHGDVLADYLGMLYEPGIPSHKLRLKVGAICTITWNLSIENGLVKNARVIIEEPSLCTRPATYSTNPH